MDKSVIHQICTRFNQLKPCRQIIIICKLIRWIYSVHANIFFIYSATPINVWLFYLRLWIEIRPKPVQRCLNHAYNEPWFEKATRSDCEISQFTFIQHFRQTHWPKQTIKRARPGCFKTIILFQLVDLNYRLHQVKISCF